MRALPVSDDRGGSAEAGSGGATATEFARWVFERNHSHFVRTPRKKPDRPLMLQPWGERELVWFRDRYLARTGRDADWRIHFEDDSGPEDPPTAPYRASGLTVGDRSRACRPDLVLEDPSSGGILVVERKQSKNLNPPRYGYQN